MSAQKVTLLLLLSELLLPEGFCFKNKTKKQRLNISYSILHVSCVYLFFINYPGYSTYFLSHYYIKMVLISKNKEGYAMRSPFLFSWYLSPWLDDSCPQSESVLPVSFVLMKFSLCTCKQIFVSSPFPIKASTPYRMFWFFM